MSCSGPGATHHLACDCREREWAERLAQTDRALYAERERVVRAELRAASLSQELLAAEKAREAWTETARMHAKNEAYYRDLIVRTLSGTPAAFVSDDGSVQQDVICAKLPELYEASEKAREEADAYAGRANARIADLGERLDATEAVLRDAESRAEKAERERDAYRHEWNVSSRQQGAETRARYAAESRAARLLTALKHLLKAFLMLHRACGTGSAEQWPEVEDARAAIAAEEGK